MIEPAIPSNEEQRIAALKRLNVLNTAPEERFDRFTRLAKRLFNSTSALVSLVDSERQWFKSRQGLDAEETPRNISFCGHAILREDTLVVEDASKDPRFSDNPLVVNEPHIRFYAGTPLHAPSGEKVGTLCIIDGEPRSFEADDLSLLHDIAAMVELDLASAAIATTDELTGLTNRRGMREIARHAIARGRREAASLALLYFDLDDFKPINDSFGHAAGDAAICEFAELLKQVFRECDIVARLGGDEFCVLLSNIDQPGAERAIVRLRELTATFNDSNRQPYQLAFSVGASFANTPDNYDLDILLAHADEAMYTEKKHRGPKSMIAA